MQGYQVTFFTQENHMHEHQPVGEWLLQEAHTIGAQGATLMTADEGFGQHRRIHAAHFFELADRPIEVTMVMGPQETERLFDVIRKNHVRVFYVKMPVEFGSTGK